MWAINRISSSLASPVKTLHYEDNSLHEVTDPMIRLNYNSSDDDIVSIPSDTWSMDKESSCTYGRTGRKTVSFSNMIMVCIIPSRESLSSIWKDLWWSFDECSNFKKQASKELKAYTIDHSCTLKQSVAALYQPDIESLQKDEESQQLFTLFDKNKNNNNGHNDDNNNNDKLMTQQPLLRRNYSDSQTTTIATTASSDSSCSNKSSVSSSSDYIICFTPDSVFTKPLLDDILIDKTTSFNKISSVLEEKPLKSTLSSLVTTITTSANMKNQENHHKSHYTGNRDLHHNSHNHFGHHYCHNNHHINNNNNNNQKNTSNNNTSNNNNSNNRNRNSNNNNTIDR